NYDETDDPISGVTVTLVSADGTVTLTDVTDANGYYEFTGLNPGEYDIYCQTKVPGPGNTTYYDFCAKGGDFAQKITPVHINVSDEIQGGESSDHNNFAKVLPGSINGYVFEDLNDANNKELGEDGISGIVVTLYKLNTNTNEYVKVATTRTDADGYYEFDIAGQYSTIDPNVRLNVNATYLVREGIVEDYTDGKDYLGTFDGEERGDNSVNEEFSDIYVGFNEHGINYNFGELKLGSIAGNVYEDRNDNGIQDEGEKGIGAVTVDLYQWDGQKYVYLRSELTENDGSYQFDDLAICYNYAVKEHQPDDYTDGQDTVGSLGGNAETNDYITAIPVGWDDHGIEYNFGELKLGSIAGNVYEDRNDNGIQDEGEAGIDNVTVDLYRWNGESYVFYKTTTTQSDGTYLFDDLPICYQYAVKEHQPNDYTDGQDAVGSLGGHVESNDYITNVEVQWDDHGVEYNFGELKLGYLSGYVYEDDNDNGVKDPGEKGIANVVVELYILRDDDYVKIDETKTDSEGFYKFTNLDINEKYGIKEIQPEDYEDGKDAIGTLGGDVVQSDYMNNISVSWDDKGYHYDFGELKPLVPGSLSGYVFFDYNNDGIMDDENDYGIENTTLTLWIWNAGTSEYELTGRTTLTNEDGYYIFTNLEPERMYRITETQPTGYEDGIDSVGTLFGKVAQDDLYDICVGSDQHGEFYNFGEIISTPIDPPKEPDTYSWTPTQRSVYVPQRYVGGPANPFNYIIDQPSPSPGTVSFFGGGGLPVSYSWHLSVLNGGYPRSIEALDSVAGFRANQLSSSYMNVSWSGEALNRGEWLIRGADGNVANRYILGFDNAIPIVGDWDGDGVDSLGLFVEGQWFMDRNGDGVWDREDLWAELGSKKDQPVVGDWDGDGKADIGVFGPQWAGDPLAVAVEPGLPADTNQFIPVSRPKNVPPTDTGLTFGQRVMKHRNSGKVRLDLVDHVFEYGNEGDRAIAGDWNGDGVSKIGVWRNGEFYLDVNGNGKWDEGDVLVSDFGGDKDSIPIVGDFDGDGIDNIGLFHNGRWMLDT
ncbi:MAG: SdrD B-like domain-containing protein, partial [Planctomycetia bacterium]|nr:SdrD B-like domain-containing protein [Planctomycetia bacterium]